MRPTPTSESLTDSTPFSLLAVGGAGIAFFVYWIATLTRSPRRKQILSIHKEHHEGTS
jgi:hypothetical protein